MDKILCKVLKFQCTKSPIYAAIYWLEDVHEIFRVTIYEDGETWSGIYCKDMALQYIHNKATDEQAYIEQLKSGFLLNDDDLFTYNFAKEKDGTAKFSWRKVLEGNSAVLIHGSVHLQKDKVPASRSNLLDITMRENILLRNNVNHLRSTYEFLENEESNYKEELNEFILMKSAVETGLYKRFRELLNVKRKTEYCSKSKALNDSESFIRIYD